MKTLTKSAWIERFITELESLGAVLSAVELVVIAEKLWPSRQATPPEASAREMFSG